MPLIAAIVGVRVVNSAYDIAAGAGAADTLATVFVTFAGFAFGHAFDDHGAGAIHALEILAAGDGYTKDIAACFALDCADRFRRDTCPFRADQSVAAIEIALAACTFGLTGHLTCAVDADEVTAAGLLHALGKDAWFTDLGAWRNNRGADTLDAL